MAEAPESRRLAAVMFTDMVGYTALTQRDEGLALSLLETQSGILLPTIREHGGTPVKTIGDAHLAEFGSALEAVRCAVEIQRRVKKYNEGAGGRAFQLRVGIHVGDVVHKSNDVYGDAVNIASRIEPMADAGGVCISQQVYDQVQNKVPFRLDKLPFRQLKNVSVSIDVYKVSDVSQGSAEAGQPEMLKERVAVLPLSNFSPNPQDEYLADGMTEELITAISGVQGLRVIARTSVMRFKDAQTNVAEVGRALNAGTILEGSFRKIGDRIRVTVQLIDARTEEHMWASNYDGDMQDIFSIQTDIAKKVAEALKAKLLERPDAQRPVDIEAYELYLKGRSFWNRRNKEGVAQALDLFRAAARKDQGFAKAYAGIADCYLIGKSLEAFPKGEADTGAAQAIQKSLELDEANAEAHASKGLLLSNSMRFTEARKEFERALSLNPSYASAHHWYAICLGCVGRLDEAVEQARAAGQCDPLSPPARNILGVLYLLKKEFDKALEVFNEVLKIDPDFTPGYGFRSQVYLYRGMEKEMKDDVQRSLARSTPFDVASTMAFVAAWLQRKEEAARQFREAEATSPGPGPLAMLRAVFAGISGDADGFLADVDEAMRDGDLSPMDVRYAWYFDRVRSDPRVADLLKRLPR